MSVTKPRSEARPAAGSFRTARLYLESIRRLRLRQVLSLVRARLIPQKTGWRLPDVPYGVRGGLPEGALFLNHDPWNTREDILRGVFKFVGRVEDLSYPVDWGRDDLPALWRFNLHYFNYLHLLQPDERLAICRDWIANNPLGRGVGWHPYPTSLRIVNWCKARMSDATVDESLYRQATHLFRNLETGVLGNHLLENARALVFAGTYFGRRGEAPDWLARGVRIYREQTPEQILADGGHFERSPMYHALVLEGYADLLELLPGDHPDRARLTDAVEQMSRFMRAMTDGDGQPFLFNDAVRDVAVEPARLLEHVSRHLDSPIEDCSAFPETGYFLVRDASLALVIDGGPIGPDYVPGHAHADIFSYCLSVKGAAIVVDSGVYEYEAGEMRSYARSTRAHNTVSIDETDQAECWSSFRVGRRFSPSDVAFVQNGKTSEFRGTFNGYGKLLGDDLIHRRSIVTDHDAGTVQVTDVVSGSGRHRVASRIHLHPSVRVEEKKDRFLLIHGGTTCILEILMGSPVWENGWFCRSFGERHRTRVLVLAGGEEMPVTRMYRFTYRNPT